MQIHYWTSKVPAMLSFQDKSLWIVGHCLRIEKNVKDTQPDSYLLFHQSKASFWSVFPSPHLPILEVGFNGSEMGCIPSARQDGMQMSSDSWEDPSALLSWWTATSQAVSQNGQWSRGTASFLFIKFWLKNSEIFQIGEKEKNKFSPLYQLCHPYRDFHIIFSTFYVRLGVWPLEGSMNLGKTAAFLKK